METEDCETCGGTGEIDETLGGISTSDPHAPCPDCRAPVKAYKHVWPAPRPCLCKWLGVIGIKCRAHSAGTT